MPRFRIRCERTPSSPFGPGEGFLKIDGEELVLEERDLADELVSCLLTSAPDVNLSYSVVEAPHAPSIA